MSVAASADALFPFNTIEDAVKWLDLYMDETDDPDLARVSILLGALEHQFTSNTGSKSSLSNLSNSSNTIVPALELSLISSLYTKFSALMRTHCQVSILSEALNNSESEEQMRTAIKHVSDIVWNTLTKGHYRDRPHLQSIYAYLTGNRLDCFGVALAVVAGCQVLDLKNVHLALSEDHAWVVFGKDLGFTAEVTWHGKGNEDKRGQSVQLEKLKHSWLYVSGRPVVCTRAMEVAAIVSSMNPSVSAHVDSIDCGTLQQQLLWLLHSKGHLERYPMALANLADLEEIQPTKHNCKQLFEEAVASAKEHYGNHHVYPHTYLAGYLFRTRQFREALNAWANAADIISRYKYSKDDEEVYKEFLEIVTDLLPQLVRQAALSAQTHAEILQSTESFAHILRLYDGICCWEEGSVTPVLHVVWAKAIGSTLNRFESSVRTALHLLESDSEDDGESSKTSLLLRSAKMRALRSLLMAEKLNLSALQLQLSAQTEVVTSRRSSNEGEGTGRSKRPRKQLDL